MLCSLRAGPGHRQPVTHPCWATKRCHDAPASRSPPPQDEAHGIIQRRFPTPRFTDCDQNGSQARFLLAKLNPSATYITSPSMSGEVIMTDDVSLQARAAGRAARAACVAGRRATARARRPSKRAGRRAPTPVPASPALWRNLASPVLGGCYPLHPPPPNTHTHAARRRFSPTT